MKIATPNFTNKKELFQYLKANKAEIINLKKSATKYTDPSSYVGLDEISIKGENATGATGDTDSEIKRSIIGNTYYWLDSHDDVHVPKCFLASINSRGVSKISHLHDHIHQLTAKVGNFSSVYEKEFPWRELGVDLDGSTTSLVGDSTIKSILNPTIFNYYKAGEINQHSVGMRYIQLSLAINDPDEKDEYAEWLKVFPLLGNKERAEKQGYFWVVKEAALIEISCVLNGSNEVTPTLLSEQNPPLGSSSNKGPQESSQDKSFKSYYHLM